MARAATAHSPASEPLPAFASRLLAWHAKHGRHDLPWQQPRDPYRVWLSEIMLQQTQVATVTGYFLRFVDALPTLPALARAPADQVMALWSGLGYYSRARNLQRAARLCVEHHGGELPADLDALMALPGIGRSTAGAILSQAFGLRAPILDGNVKRVLCRSHGIDGFPGQRAIELHLWWLADALLPPSQLADYTQAIMDLGATVCTRARPECGNCPLRDDCVALATGRVAELPTPRPRRTLPQRSAAWLVAVHDSRRVLLHRRPSPGIWGGLWSLPEFPDESSLRGDRALGTTFPPPALVPMPAVRHVFTHYALTAQPFRLDIGEDQVHVFAPGPGVAEQDGCRWHPLDELASIGIPQPVRRLLTGLRLRED
ncbi:A/G-specific adenine glycosylase [Pseudofulvimonas gallinarii]|uniref:Adenine DNA glycosylase n=2 Tax=Pseudofulvimonas gallinarii TaxID=634155 RepID=A0A4R3LGX1_9GAMM|nr:A/G-specific adenine glycosylase [Pseudofulvimonas gallinarii]TCS99282.1 A/G-specific DNA-adenine glycosylase [Pseudofulvimonas gallinarii]